MAAERTGKSVLLFICDFVTQKITVQCTEKEQEKTQPVRLAHRVDLPAYLSMRLGHLPKNKMTAYPFPLRKVAATQTFLTSY